MTEKTPPTGGTTKVVLKALAVLERLAAEGGESGISEIARASAIDKATVYRLLNTLAIAGYVTRIEATGRYRITPRLAGLAGKHSVPRSLMELALPLMRELARASGETVYIAVINGDDAVFLDKVEGEQTIRVHTANGSRIPLFAGSAAKALLAFQPATFIARVLTRLAPVTPYTVVDANALRRQLASIRTRGYAIGDQEWRVGVSGVAAPVRDASAAVIAAVGISGPSERLGRSRLRAIAPDVIANAARLSRALGWRDADEVAAGTRRSRTEAR